jgi:hypothetical protein
MANCGIATLDVDFWPVARRTYEESLCNFCY